MGGGFPSFNFGNRQHPAGANNPLRPERRPSRQKQRCPRAGNGRGHPHPKPAKKQGRTAGHRNGRTSSTGGRLARLQAKTPDQTVAYATRANLRPAARTQRTARRQQPPPRNSHPGTLPGQYHQRQIPALLHATQHVLHQQIRTSPHTPLQDCALVRAGAPFA